MSRYHILGVVATVLVHGGVIAGVWGLQEASASDRKELLACKLQQVIERIWAREEAAQAVVSSDLDALHDRVKRQCRREKSDIIEAGLAAKKKVAKTTRKTSLPPKDVAPKVKPPAPKVESTETDPTVSEAPPPDAVVDPRLDAVKTSSKNDSDLKNVRKDKTDKDSVFDQFRNKDSGELASLETELGTADENKAGTEEGSEYGMLDKAKGDPYVGLLIGHMTVKPDFIVPTTVTQAGLVTVGCVKLDRKGRIVERKLDPENKSKSYAFNSAVEDRLRQTEDMEEPVPEGLIPLLVEQFACVRYRY